MAAEKWGMGKQQQKKLLDIFVTYVIQITISTLSVEHKLMLGSIYSIFLMFTVVISHNKDVSEDARQNHTEFLDQSSHCYVESANGILIN